LLLLPTGGAAAVVTELCWFLLGCEGDRRDRLGLETADGKKEGCERAGRKEKEELPLETEQGKVRQRKVTHATDRAVIACKVNEVPLGEGRVTTIHQAPRERIRVVKVKVGVGQLVNKGPG
jgi:hypothetical protein